jgi:hypothetical protein
MLALPKVFNLIDGRYGMLSQSMTLQFPPLRSLEDDFDFAMRSDLCLISRVSVPALVYEVSEQ